MDLTNSHCNGWKQINRPSTYTFHMHTFAHTHTRTHMQHAHTCARTCQHTHAHNHRYTHTRKTNKVCLNFISGQEFFPVWLLISWEIQPVITGDKLEKQQWFVILCFFLSIVGVEEIQNHELLLRSRELLPPLSGMENSTGQGSDNWQQVQNRNKGIFIQQM